MRSPTPNDSRAKFPWPSSSISPPSPRTSNRSTIRGTLAIANISFLISVCGIIGGCDGPTAIHRRAKHRQSWPAQSLALPNGIPSRDCIRRTPIVLKPEAFRRGLQARIGDIILVDADDPDRLVAIDGKSCRRWHDRAKDLGALHIVGAWATGEGIALGQVATDAKSGEITAIPQLLEQIDPKGTLITIDAIGCRKEIVEPIVAGGGDCVIAVKDDRPKLLAAIQKPFFDHPDGDLKDLKPQSHEAHEDGHGRIDDRYYDLAEVPSDFACREGWPWVKAIGLAVRITRHADGTETDEVRYYLSGRTRGGQRFAEAVRGHRGIESMHWVLDVDFREDDSRRRERTLGNDLSRLRRFAVTMLKRHPDKDSLGGKMKSRMLNTDYLTQVLLLQHV